MRVGIAVSASLLAGMLLSTPPLPADASPQENVETWRFFGPLRIRDMTAPSILQLSLMPAHGVHEVRGWALESHLSHANNFALSENVEEFLRAEKERTGRRARLTPEFADRVFEEVDGDLFYFDSAISILSLTAHYFVDERWSVAVTLPIYSYNGGVLDSTIERFHQEFGFSAAGRDLVERRQSLIFQRFGNSTFAGEPRDDAGLADPVFQVRFAQPLGTGWRLVTEGAVKLPLGERDDFFSSGNPDYGTQLSFQWQGHRNAFYVGGSWVWTGEIEFIPDLDPNDFWTLNGAWELRLDRHTNLVLQGDWGSTLFDGVTDARIADTKSQVSAGVRHGRGRFVYSLAVTENISNFNNSPDIGFHLGLSYALGRLRGLQQ